MLAALLVIGCEVGPNYQAPKTPEPAAFSQAETRPTTEPATTQLAEIPTPQQLQRWWEMFNDPELNILIARGVKNNLDLKVAKERVIEARAQLGIANAGLFPTIDATGEYSHSRRSKNLGSSGGGISTGTTGTTGTTTTGGGGAGNPVSDFYQAGFDATWEIDVFGGVRRGVEAAQANVESQVDNQQSVLITLLGDVATDYVQLRGLQKQVAITEENIGTQKQSLALIQTKNRAGLVADLDVTQQTAQVLTTQAELPDLEAQILTTIHQIGLLLGTEPGTLEAELSPPAPIPFGPPHVPPGLPSELVRRRPDIRSAERALAESSANIGVAVADLYPKFTLNGALVDESSQFKRLFQDNSRYYSIVPGVTWNLFDGGAIRANIDVQNSLERQALYTYTSTVLTGLQEVDSALITYAKEQDRRALLEEAVKSDQRSVEMTQDLYRNGLDTFLDVLTAQNTLLAGEQQLTISQQSVAGDLVALYIALGGGWEVGPD
jgi:NodT family efflux transporter outer membrane factor (OMF) lipoprotein